MEKQNIIIISVIGVILLLLFGWQSGIFTKAPAGPVNIPEGIILFYGQGCPHCKIVDDFISQNKIEDKVKFTRLEVWYDKTNQVILGQVAQKCNITSSQVGVPFLYDPSTSSGRAGRCYEGDVDTVNFFKAQAGIK